MANTLKKFGYHLLGGGDLIVTPMVHIVLQSWSTQADGAISISPTLTESEIDGYVEALKADLDAVAKQAKSAVQKAHQKNLNAIKARRGDA